MKNICSSPTSTWSPEREARAVRLYMLEGFTAAEVADLLGGLTRAAVVGKMRRLGFLKRRRASTPSAVAPATRPLRCDRRLPPQPPPIPLPPLRRAPPTGRPRPLACLADGACRWPIDDPGPGRMHLALFCAGPAGRHTYCREHRLLAARPPRQPSVA